MKNKEVIKNKIVPAIKRDIKLFLFSEEAKITKQSIFKIGMGLAVLGSMLNSHLPGAMGQTHASSFYNVGDHGEHSSGPGLHTSHASHGSHSAHGSHGSHGSHSAHGSHGSHGSHSSHSSHGSHGSHGQW